MKNTIRVILDVIRWPFLSLWLKFSSRRIPILPGQVWYVPDAGAVLIRMTDKDNVYYTSLQSRFYENDSEIILKANRVEFLIHSSRYFEKVESQEKQENEGDAKNIVSIFDFKKPTSDYHEH